MPDPLPSPVTGTVPIPTLVVRLGNSAPVDPQKIGDTLDVTKRPLVFDNGRDDNNTITSFSVPAVKLLESLSTITTAYRTHHSNNEPEWVECDDPFLAKLLADEFSNDEHTCVVGRPADWIGEQEPCA